MDERDRADKAGRVCHDIALRRLAIVIIAVYLMAADAVMSSAAYLSVAFAVTVCIDALLCIWLKKRGAAVFAEL